MKTQAWNLRIWYVNVTEHHLIFLVNVALKAVFQYKVDLADVACVVLESLYICL